MMTRGLTPLALAGLLVCTGCAVRTATTPTSVAPARVPGSAGQKPPKSAAAPEKPAVATDTVTGHEVVLAGVVPDAAVPAAPAPVPSVKSSEPEHAKTAAGQAPSATASVYVFSPQQAATAPAATLPQAAAVHAAATTPSAASAPVPTAKVAPTETTPTGDTAPAATPRGELQLVVLASAPETAAGGIVTVDVMATSDTAVLDAPLHLSFDPNVMAYVDGTPGDFLSQGGSSIVFFADGSTRPGDVAVAAGRVDRQQGATGSGLLCRVRLRAVAAGTTPVTVAQAKAWGIHGEELNVLAGGTQAAVR